jgi:hypothetical protein
MSRTRQKEIKARSAVTVAGRIRERISESDQHPALRQGLQKSNGQ